MIRRPPRSTQSRSSAASDVYKRQGKHRGEGLTQAFGRGDHDLDLARGCLQVAFYPESTLEALALLKQSPELGAQAAAEQVVQRKEKLTLDLFEVQGMSVKALREAQESIHKLDQLCDHPHCCLLYTSPSPRDRTRSRMPSSA
eukprot:TRINITY_DN8871_c0_g1_i1.p1 TRINITY_DN8871_c0_g1~~TRINITY_DN8871_c0_g1_i1.p1  ORF type:complete len:143 (-),score=65.93 TRINITY_DN8871_c0_g1_i1:88-516(-)